jgi:2-oxoglutarate dehydrogenase E1 component
MLRILARRMTLAGKYYGPSAGLRPRPEPLSGWGQFAQHLRRQGHHFCRLDPVNIFNPSPLDCSILDFGLRYDQPLEPGQGYAGEVAADPAQFEALLKKLYAGTVGVEFDHVADPEEQRWLYYHYEKAMLQKLSPTEKAGILRLMVQS